MSATPCGLGREHAATPIGEADAAASEAPHRQPLPGAREVGRHRGRGQHGRPEPLERERRGETHAVELRLGLQPHPGPGRLHLELVAQRRARSAQQEGVVAELRERDPVALGQGVIVGRDEHQVFLEELLGCQLDVVGGQVHDGEVEVPGQELERQRGGARFDHDGVDPGMVLTETVEEAGHEPSGGGPDDPETHVAAELGAEAGDVGPDRVELGLHPTRPRHDCGAFDREPPGLTVDEGRVELALEVSDMGRDVRLHGVQRLRRARERAVLGHCDEGLELADVHDASVPLPSLKAIGIPGDNYWTDRDIETAY